MLFVPGLKVAAVGMRRIMTVVDVCTSQCLNYILELRHPASQNVVQNKKDFEAIAQKLESIITIAQKYQQYGCQRALDRRIEDLSTCSFIMLHGLLRCSRVPQCYQRPYR